MRRACLAVWIVAGLVAADAASAQTPSRVIRLIDERCANCHREPVNDRAPDVEGAPEAATLRRMAPDTILRAITTGPMRVHWSFLAETGVRNAASIGPAFAEASAGRPAAAEASAGGSLNYPCCTFRGSIVALEAATGRQIWKTYAIPDPPKPSRRNSKGTQLWTGAGAAIWHAPTIAARRRALYVATGDAYTEPAHRNTDAVMAIDMDTGAVRWAVQDYENDAWLVACAQDPTENCPKNLGPDYDFGASPILQTLADGRRVLLAGQKSGQVFAHDPDRDGALLWKAALVETIGESEILFGGAADARTAYFGLDNGAIGALDPATGQRVWYNPPAPPGPRRGFTAALTAIPGVVFAGNQDGTLRPYAADTGRVVWTFTMLRDFSTVNRVPARGGSMGAPGPTAAGGMLFVPSGYVGLGNGTPGNVLLVFGLP